MGSWQRHRRFFVALGLGAVILAGTQMLGLGMALRALVAINQSVEGGGEWVQLASVQGGL